MPTTLHTRFKHWVVTQCHAEELDLSVEHVQHVKVADYVFRESNVILEQKEITVEVQQKIQAMEMEMNRLGRVYGFDPSRMTPHEIDAAITGIRDRFENNPVYLRNLRFIEKDLSLANRQLAHTKQRLDTPTAASLVVLLNEASGNLSTNVIMWAVDRLLRRSAPDGGRRFANLDGVMLFHMRPFSGPRQGIACYTSAYTNPLADRFALHLMQAWSGNPVYLGHADF